MKKYNDDIGGSELGKALPDMTVGAIGKKARTIHPSVTSDRVLALAESEAYGLENPGICLSCGEEADGCEPDARGYECEGCGEKAVYGAAEIMVCNLYHVSPPKPTFTRTIEIVKGGAWYTSHCDTCRYRADAIMIDPNVGPSVDEKSLLDESETKHDCTG